MHWFHNLPIPSHIFFCADPFLSACVAVNGRQQSDTIATDGSVINICTEEVVRALKRTKVNTAPGPHMICGCTLKRCVDQLGGMFRFFFQSSVASSTARQLWKHSTVIPLPQKSTVSTLNDLRPVAFTSLVMKALERVIKNAITAVDFQLDPLQFTYRAGRGVDQSTKVILKKCRQWQYFLRKLNSFWVSKNILTFYYSPTPSQSKAETGCLVW